MDHSEHPNIQDFGPLLVGEGLEPTEVEALEQSICKNPNDVEKRLLLLGFYNKNARLFSENHVEHLLWMINNTPENLHLQNLSVQLGKPDYARLAVQWLRQSRIHSNNG